MNASLARNAIANVLQMVIGAVLLFTLYRYINDRLGVAALGIWSVVMATVSASRLADFGIGAAMVRFVARDLARNDPKAAAIAVETGVLSVAALLALILPLLYFVAEPVLGLVFSGKDIEGALMLLPYALISLWLGMAGMVSQSALDGCQRMDVRAMLVVAGQALLLGLAVLLVPTKGLVGLAWAQIGQGLFLLVAGWLLLRRQLRQLSWIPHRFSWPRLKEMLGYGINVQIAGIFMMLFDPVAKLLMARFGGAEAAGYFEMANQIVQKARSLIFAVSQALIPDYARHQDEQDIVRFLYRKSTSFSFTASLFLFSLLTIWSGLISLFLVCSVSPHFLYVIGVFVGASFLNTVAASPLYFCNLGVGRADLNIFPPLLRAGIMFTLGMVGGTYFGGAGVLGAYVFAIIASSIIPIEIYKRAYGGVLHDLDFLSFSGLVLVFLCLVGSLASIMLWLSELGIIPKILALIFISIVLIFIVFRYQRDEITELVKMSQKIKVKIG